MRRPQTTTGWSTQNDVRAQRYHNGFNDPTDRSATKIRFDGKRVNSEADQGISRFVSRPANGLRRGCDCLKHGLNGFLAVEVPICVAWSGVSGAVFSQTPS